jgi:hypothetical protein
MSCGVCAIGAAVVLSGCGGEGTGGPAPSSSSPAVESESPSASPSASPSLMSGEEAEKVTARALLPTSAFEKIGLTTSEKPESKRWDWFETCVPQLPSDARAIRGTYGVWSTQGLVVAQTVMAYPEDVATEVPREAEQAVSCTEYTTAGHEYRKVAPVDLPSIPAADESFGWCAFVDDEDVWQCHSVVATNGLVSAIWALSADKDTALDALGGLTQLAAARIELRST